MVTAAAVVALLAVVLGATAVWGFVKFNDIDRVSVDLAPVDEGAPRNLLIIGSDTREIDRDGEDAGAIFGSPSDALPGGRRADTIVIARVDAATSNIELLSVPRDLWVTDSDGDKGRINSSYNDGPQEVIDTIERELGVPIHHYVEVDFNGFKSLVDALDGVPMYFETPIRDSHTGLDIDTVGCRTMDGVEALAYARSRHLEWSNGVEWVVDGTADLGRITRQQVFLRHAIDKLATLGIGDIGAMRELVNAGVDNVTIDDQLSTSEIIDLSQQFKAFSGEQLVVHRLPTVPHRSDGGSEVLLLDNEAAFDVLSIFRLDTGPTEVEVTPTTELGPAAVSVTVSNGSGITGLASTTAAALEEWGFVIDDVGDETALASSVIRYGEGGQAAAEMLASKISPSPRIVESENLVGHQVQLVLADDTAKVAIVPGGATTTSTTTTTEPAPADVQVGVAPGDPPPGVICD